jgi:predicted 3-demethylubiquinone-9 3-methyltransferase (glyoxalase superfamily)
MATIKSTTGIITPCLWFNTNAEEAVDFYMAVFKKSKKNKVARYGKGGPMPEGTVLTVSFTLNGQEFLALNGGPEFNFTEAVSFIVNCKTQKEIDYYWEGLSKGGTKNVCGWLKDKFGLSWQVAPDTIGKMLTDKNPQRASRVLQAVMKMKKPVLKDLEEAYNG